MKRGSNMGRCSLPESSSSGGLSGLCAKKCCCGGPSINCPSSCVKCMVNDHTYSVLKQICNHIIRNHERQQCNEKYTPFDGGKSVNIRLQLSPCFGSNSKGRESSSVCGRNYGTGNSKSKHEKIKSKTVSEEKKKRNNIKDDNLDGKQKANSKRIKDDGDSEKKKNKSKNVDDEEDSGKNKKSKKDKDNVNSKKIKHKSTKDKDSEDSKKKKKKSKKYSSEDEDENSDGKGSEKKKKNSSKDRSNEEDSKEKKKKSRKGLDDEDDSDKKRKLKKGKVDDKYSDKMGKKGKSEESEDKKRRAEVELLSATKKKPDRSSLLKSRYDIKGYAKRSRCDEVTPCDLNRIALEQREMAQCFMRTCCRPICQPLCCPQRNCIC